MKNCATCKFMNFRCKGKCGDCVHKVEENPSVDESPRHVVALSPLGKGRNGPPPFRQGGLDIEEKCKCIECYDEDSGKYRYWEEEPELMKCFGGAE